MKSRNTFLEAAFPIFVVEDRQGEYVGYDIVKRWSDFVTFGRVPARGEFNAGYAFDVTGKMYRYESELGWPRFSKGWKGFLEALVLPGPLFKIIAHFTYYGPDIQPGEVLDLARFQEMIFKRMQVYEKGRDAKQLRELIGRATSYAEVIDAINWYRFYGGRRDKDGHLLDENGDPKGA